MRVAVIGSGVSGLVAAHLLSTRHDVTLYEAAGYPGGHANTETIQAFGHTYDVDTGFMVFNDRTYPQFCRLLARLGVESQASDMSFSVSCERTGLEYQGSSLSGLFAQRTNLLKPAFYRLLADILRFHRQAVDFLATVDERPVAVRDFLSERSYGPLFRDQYLLPMVAAIWSSPGSAVLDMPARFLLSFMHNHGLLQLSDRPQWRTIVGGSRAYVRRLIDPLGAGLRLNTPVAAVERHDDHVVVHHAAGTEVFAVVVMATHADQALRVLRDADASERALLAATPYHSNEVVLHTDRSQLPRRRRAWASWNYRVAAEDSHPASVTYDLTRLQRIAAPAPLLVTLNPLRPIPASEVLRRYSYQHPAFSHASLRAQRRWQQVDGRRRTHFCGAYWGNGFHEDGVVSALAVTKKFGIGLESCGVASTKATLRTTARIR